MTFVLTEEQQMLKDSASQFVAERLPVTELRKLRTAKSDQDPVAWKEMAELGWTGVLIPEEHGGSDFGYVGLGQILEAQGRTLVASPLLQTALIGASALRLAGTDGQKTEYLPRIASGDIQIALAVDEHPHHKPSAVATTATTSGGKIAISGKKTFVVDGGSADAFLVSAVENGSAGLYIVPSDAKGVSIERLTVMDAHAAANVTFDKVEIAADAKMNGDGEMIDAVLDRARVGYAAEMLGLSDEAFKVTLEYLKTRKQFGQLIGSFQSLQHRAGIMFSELEQTRSCVAAALAELDNDSGQIARLASLAKARAGETAHLVTNEMVQMHGGVGMTDEYDAGLYMKRARVLEGLYGGESFHRNRYATQLGF